MLRILSPVRSLLRVAAPLMTPPVAAFMRFSSNSSPAAPPPLLQSRSLPPRRPFATAASTGVIPVVSKADLERLMLDESDFVLLDVRNPAELAHGALPAARNVPLAELADAFALSPAAFTERYGFHLPTKTTKIVAYCRTGARSERAAMILQLMGFVDVSNYRGSFVEWFGKSYDM